MDIKDFKARKRKLERDINIAINGMLDEFEKDTGCCPHEINMEMVESSEITGDPKNRWFLGPVEIKIDL